MAQLALFALGSNKNVAELKPRDILLRVFDEIRREFPEGLEISRIFETPAFPVGAGPNFANAAGCFYTHETPQCILQKFHSIEADFSRVRNNRWEPRSLDVDLIGVSDVVSPNTQVFEFWRGLSLSRQKSDSPEELILPHPRLQDRSFVLVPLAEVAPNWRHPVLGKTVQELLAALPAEDVASVRPL